MTVRMGYSAMTSTGERARQRRWTGAGTPFGTIGKTVWRQKWPYLPSLFRPANKSDAKIAVT